MSSSSGFGWFGFNGGSQLAVGSATDAVAMSIVLVNTNLAAAAGVMAALAVSRSVLGRVDLFAGLNGAIAGLVSITAAPNIAEPAFGIPAHLWAIIIGAIGGAICVGGLKLLEKVNLDDVVGAVPAHLFAGVWGTLAASIAGGAKPHIQLLGIVAIGVFVFVVAWALVATSPAHRGRPRLGACRAPGPRRRGARHGILPRVRAHARAGRRRLVRLTRRECRG